MNAGFHFIHRKRLSNDAGRCDDHILRSASKRIGRNLLHADSIFLSLGSRTGICTACIGNNRMCRVCRNNRLRNMHGSCCNGILRECPCNGSFFFTVDHSNIGIAASFDARLDSSCQKSFRVGNPCFCTLFTKHMYFLHSITDTSAQDQAPCVHQIQMQYSYSESLGPLRP